MRNWNGWIRDLEIINGIEAFVNENVSKYDFWIVIKAGVPHMPILISVSVSLFIPFNIVSPNFTSIGQSSIYLLIKCSSFCCDCHFYENYAYGRPKYWTRRRHRNIVRTSISLLLFFRLSSMFLFELSELKTYPSTGWISWINSFAARAPVE